MTVQGFLRTLKTAKTVTQLTLNSSTKIDEALNSSTTPFKTLINSSKPHNSTKNNVQIFLSSLTSHQLHTFLSDPSIKTSDCFRVFNLVIHSQSCLSFKPDFHSHFTILCRLIKSRFFNDAEFLLQKLCVHPDFRYPFEDFVRYIEKYCNESKIITKMLNMLLKKYSDHGLFEMATTTFNYMVEKGIDRDEQACSIHLHSMVKAGKSDLAYEFFCRMVDSSMEISVFSVTIVISGLCKIGQLRIARELIQEMSEKGTQPNVITFNNLVDACARRLDLTELELVLSLMQEEKIQFDENTYKILINGYTSSGKVEEAEKMLLDMHDKDFEAESYLYLIVIKGYCRIGKANNGFSLFSKMKDRTLQTSVYVYRSLKELLIEMHKNGVVNDDDMFDLLVDMCQKAGMVGEVDELRKMRCSQVESVLGDEADNEIIDSLDDEGDTLEEMVVDDVVKAYLSPEKDCRR